MALEGRRVALLVAATVVWAHGIGGCEAILNTGSLSERSDDGGGVDATTKDAMPGDVGSSDVENETSDGAPCTGATVFVSQTTGSDSNSGCGTSTPKQTIAAGLAAAKASGVTSIEVCKGTYDETPLTLDFAASIRGGYDCTSWKRTTTYGYPTFDGTNETIVNNAAPSVSGNVLTVSGVAITSSYEIDGLTIQGAASGTCPGSGTALNVENSAAPVISNDKLSGGGTTASSGLGSAGITIEGGGAPLVQNNHIAGGSGTAGSNSGNASVGIYTDGTNGNVTITNNVIDGGSGTNPVNRGSVALVLRSTNTVGVAYTVRGNLLTAGTGTAGASGAATSGVDLSDNASLTLDGNSVDGGGGTSGSMCPYAVYVGTTGSVTITSNRLFGGNCDISGSSASTVRGLSIAGAPTSLEIINNMIHMGTATASVGGSAIDLGASVAPVIRHNTLLGGPSPATTSALYLHGTVTGAVIENNILAQAPGASGQPLIAGCVPDAGPAEIQSFRNNLVVGALPGPYQLYRTVACSGAGSSSTMDAMTAVLIATQTGATVANNLTMAPSCGTDTGCIANAACTTEGGCLAALFAGWDQASIGHANLFHTPASVGACPPTMPGTGDGWPLAPSAPCAVTRGSLNDNLAVGTDLYGNCRNTGTPSFGAAESPADRADAGTCAAPPASDAGPADASGQ
jgi:hypothetical protein